MGSMGRINLCASTNTLESVQKIPGDMSARGEISGTELSSSSEDDDDDDVSRADGSIGGNDRPAVNSEKIFRFFLSKRDCTGRLAIV